MLKSRRGNVLLLSTAAAIAGSFGIYFFIAVTEMSENTKQRVTHLYNAHTMATAIDSFVRGKTSDEDYLADGKTLVTSELDEKSPAEFRTAEFIDLKEMREFGLIGIAMDVTATKLAEGDEIPYDLLASGCLLTHAKNKAGAAPGTDPVTHLILACNLAGTTNTLGDSKMGGVNEPFYYIYGTQGIGGNAPTYATTTIKKVDTTIFPLGILDRSDGGPRSADVVNLPADFE